MNKPGCFDPLKVASRCVMPSDGWPTISRNRFAHFRCRPSTTPFIGGRENQHPRPLHSGPHGAYAPTCRTGFGNSYDTGTFSSFSFRSHAIHHRSNRCLSSILPSLISSATTSRPLSNGQRTLPHNAAVPIGHNIARQLSTPMTSIGFWQAICLPPCYPPL